MKARELSSDRRLLVIVGLPGEDEMVVRDGRLPRKDRVAAGDLIERVNGERRRAVRRRQQIRVDAQRGAWPDLGGLIDAVSPGNLLGGGQTASLFGIGPLDVWRRSYRLCEFTTANLDNAAAPADLVFFRGQGNRFVRLALGLIGEPP